MFEVILSAWTVLRKKLDTGHCTYWPDLWYGECCANHDATASDKNIEWILQNWWLAKCVWSSSWSSQRKWWEKLLGRSFIIPGLMFFGTSTFGWLWRVKAIEKEVS